MTGLPPVTIRTAAGDELPPLLTTRQAAEILGWNEDTVTQHCHEGLIEVLPREKGSPWQIITAKLLSQLGLLEDLQSDTTPVD